MPNRVCWDIRIAEAEERGHFIPSDRVAASDWSSCAVGDELAHREMPLRVEALPTSIYVWGCAFMRSVQADHVEEAAVFHDKIKQAFVEKYGPRQEER